MSMALINCILDAGRLYQRLLAPARNSAELSQTELDILLFLANNPAYDTAGDIASIRRLTEVRVSEGLGQLEDKGLLLRRGGRLELTAAAAPVVELGRAGQREFSALLSRGLSPGEPDRLEGLMERIRSNLTQALGPAPD